MKKENKFSLHVAALFLVCFTATNVQAQKNYDLLNSKELSQLSELNPAYTGILNNIRVLVNKGEEVNLGMEMRLFKSKNYIGLNYTNESLDQLNRQIYRASYVRDYKFNERLKLKVAGNLEYQNKTIKDRTLLTKSFDDFDGASYYQDSALVNQFQEQISFADFGLGAGLIFGNLVFGINIKHLNTPEISMEAGRIRKSDMEFNAQAMGFLELTLNWRLIPNLIFAKQGSTDFISYGLGVNFKDITLSSQYEEIGTLSQLDMGLSFLVKHRYFVNLSYVNPISAVQASQEAFLRLTINSSLF
ncbi:MAG: hypothetical protein ACI9NN_001721, partial [Bacteroidia bacterium]